MCIQPYVLSNTGCRSRGHEIKSQRASKRLHLTLYWILGQHFFSYQPLIRSGQNTVKVKGFTLSPTERRKQAEGGRWRRKRASVCDYGANSNLLMSARLAVRLLEISQMARATLFYLQPAGSASSQGTDCSLGTPLMPGTKEELSRGQCHRAEIRAASSVGW